MKYFRHKITVLIGAMALLFSALNNSLATNVDCESTKEALEQVRCKLHYDFSYPKISQLKIGIRELSLDRTILTKTFKDLTIQSEKGNSYATLALANLLSLGDYKDLPYSKSTGAGFDLDETKYLELLAKAKESDIVEVKQTADFLLNCHKLGLRIPYFGTEHICNFIDERSDSDIQSGLLGLIKNAKDGNNSAAEMLALIYNGLANKKGNFIKEPDARLGFYWQLRAAEFGDTPQNAYEAAIKYFCGTEATKNFQKAAQYFKFGAKRFAQAKKNDTYEVDMLYSTMCAEALAYMVDKKIITSDDKNFSKKVRAKIDLLADNGVYISLIKMYRGNFVLEPDIARQWNAKLEKNAAQNPCPNKIVKVKKFDAAYYTPTSEEIAQADSGDTQAQAKTGIKFSELYIYKLRKNEFSDYAEISSIREQALKYLEAAAQAGNYEAQMRLCTEEYASLTRNGYKPPTDNIRRIYWAEIAAKTGRTEAILALRNCYKQDLKKIADINLLLQKKADAGDYEARWILRSDASGFTDEIGAKKYFTALDAQCQIYCDAYDKFTLGLLYFYGVGTPRDIQKGIRLLQHSAMGISPCDKSMYILHHIYKNGIGVNSDEQKSRYWLDKFKRCAFAYNTEALAKMFSEKSSKYGKIIPYDESAVSELNKILKEVSAREALIKFE